MTTTYLVVTPRYVARVSSVQAALARAAMCERRAAATYGPGAGADCYVVRDRDGALDYRGHACGRELIGRTFGCADGIVARAAAAVARQEVRS